MPKIVEKEELKVLNPEASRKKIFDEDIAPLLGQLKIACEKNNFPIFITICIDPHAKVTYRDAPASKQIDKTVPMYESMYKHDFVSPCNTYGNPNTLMPDYIAECIKIIQGFKAQIPTQEIMEEADDF